MASGLNRYARLLEDIFHSRYREGASSVEFERVDLVTAAQKLGIPLPKNLGDIVYSFRYRGGNRSRRLGGGR
jgi:hypothetical protein